MTGAQWFLLACLLIFLVGSRFRISRAFPRGPVSLAANQGDLTPAVLYSFTGAMMPWKKETASRHPLSYILGVVYHAGIFLGFIWLVIVFFRLDPPRLVVSGSAALLAVGAACGLALLVKRAVTREMRYLSNPDDYFSNALVTGFLVMAAMTARALAEGALLGGGAPAAGPAGAGSTTGSAGSSMPQWLLIYGGVMLLYIPVGKLRHALYFGLARIYLGLFYGRRGVWPAGKKGSWRA